MMGTSDAAIRQPDWTKRIRRAGELADRFPHATEVLTFYTEVLEFQQKIASAIASTSLISQPDVSFREQLKADVVLPHLPTLLLLVEKRGPAKLAKHAREVRRSSGDQQTEMIERIA